MTRRELFFKTARRELEGYIPFYFSLSPSALDKFRAKTGREDYAAYYDFPIKFISLKPKTRDIDFRAYYQQLPDDAAIDSWGVAHNKGSFEHFTRMHHPMENFGTLDDFKKFPYPDPAADFDWKAIEQPIREAKENDYIAYSAPGSLGPTIFEIAWYLRGMDNFMVDMISEPGLAHYHLDRITEIRCEGAKNFAAAGVDVIRLGDDIGTQRDLMISRELYVEFLKPRMKKIIDAAKSVNPEILIDYHCDGQIEKIIPDLIEAGVDILNPVQPECMDPVKIKELYGDKLSFNGTLGTQTTMPFGSAEEVDRVCREMIEKVGKGGGLILAPTHVIEPEVPWENMEAFLSAIKKYGKYKSGNL